MVYRSVHTEDAREDARIERKEICGFCGFGALIVEAVRQGLILEATSAFMLPAGKGQRVFSAYRQDLIIGVDEEKLVNHETDLCWYSHERRCKNRLILHGRLEDSRGL